MEEEDIQAGGEDTMEEEDIHVHGLEAGEDIENQGSTARSYDIDRNVTINVAVQTTARIFPRIFRHSEYEDHSAA